MKKRIFVTEDYMKDLYKNLSILSNISPRLVKNYHEQHLERGWGGNWVANFISDFILADEEDKEENLNNLLDHHKYMVNKEEGYWGDPLFTAHYRAIEKLNRSSNSNSSLRRRRCKRVLKTAPGE